MGDYDTSSGNNEEDPVGNLALMVKEKQVQGEDTEHETRDEVDYSIFLNTLKMN